MSENKEMPNGWTKTIFEDLLDYIQPTKFIVQSTEYDDKYKTPVLTAGKSFILGKTNESNDIFNELPVIIFDDFTTATKFVNFPFKVKSSAMKILSPASKLVNIMYVFYYMQTLRINADTHKRYWISHYSKLSVPLPPFSEQQRIVAKIEELFSSLDKGIESLKAAQQQLKVYRQAVLKWAFEGKLTKSNTQKWQYEFFKNCLKFSQGIQVDVNLQSHVKLKNQVRFLRIIDFTQGNDPERYIDNPGDKYFVRKEDIALVRYGATTGFVCTGFEGAIANNLFQVIPEERIFKKYLYYFLNSSFFQQFISQNIKGAAMPAVSFGLINDIELPIPPTIEEQQLIVDEIESRLSVCDKIEESIEQSLKQSESLRQSILKKAFEGKLVLQDTNDEPASKLLERIRAEKEALKKKK